MYLLKKDGLARTATTFVVAFALLLGFLLLPQQWMPGSLVPKADNVAQSLPFAQAWTATSLITSDDIWSGVPGITGYRGDALVGSTGVNPQTVVTESAVVDVNANQTNPNTFTTGGVAEFHITNPVVALQGSGTARAPYLQLNLNTVGKTNVNVSYNVRDIDGSADNAVQPLALQYRVGATGNFTNIPEAFVADATTGPSIATLVTPVSVTLPAAANNQSIVQVRMITTDAAGSDEWIGIDDISVTGSGDPTNAAPTITAPSNPATTVNENAAPFSVGLNGNDDGGVYNWSATAGTGVQSVTVTSGQGTPNVGFQVTLQNNFSGTATFTASLSDGVNTPATQAVNISVTPAVQNNAPTITAPANPITTVAQDAAPFTVSLSGADDNNILNWSAQAGSGVSNVSVTGGQGTANVTYTVTLQSGFSGTASFVAGLSDGVNPVTNQTVNITVTPAPPPPIEHVVISQVYGGGGNANASYQNDFVEIYNPTSSTVDTTGWSVQYGSATGSTWQVQNIGGPIGPGEYLLISLGSGTSTAPALPAANIIGDINMSATAGKVALVSNGTPLSGCQTSAPVIDLIGYGATANCREGGVNGPAPVAPTTNSTAMFRKNSGATDTNVNGNDFEIAPASPRRTAPITELGPWVASSDPALNQTTAPKDGTVSIFFSEPVDAVGAWFDITCASTGSHNSATVDHTLDFKTWAITPNSNFQYGEQCTVTVIKDQIHDQDTDDSNPNTDTLFADHSFTFTVVQAGAPAPYPSSVHLALGNPSGALADVNQPDNYLMEKESFSLSYNRAKATPNWVSWHLEPAWYGTLSRVDTFRSDPAVPSDWYRVGGFDYSFSGFDRGHMTPNADRDHQASLPLNQATYLMTNMIPQAPDNNQGPWANMENDLRRIADAGNELYIVAGPAGQGGAGSNGSASVISSGRITVPAYTWKVALVLSKQDGDDIGRISCGTRAIAVIMPNVQGIRSVSWQSYITNVDAVEELTGYDLYSNVPANIQACVESNTDGVNDPPVALPQSVTTNEDTALSITLTASDVDSPNLMYSVVNGPENGVLSGAAPNLTYTPAPNYFGSDSFTFRANDGQTNSATVTVSITVASVNDSPLAANDSASTEEDTAVVVDVLANDSDPDADSLIVDSVTQAANGTLSIEGLAVKYRPAANFNGSDSFTYTLSDGNGGRAVGTVNVTVTAVNDPPVASNDLASTTEDNSVSVNVLSNDSDVENDSLSVTGVTNGSHGTVVNNGTSVTYSPALNFFGTDSFTYTVSDGNGGMATATVSVTITPINDVPTVINNLATQSVQYSDAAQTVEVTASDVETPASALTAAASFSSDNAGSWQPGLPAGLSLVPSSTSGKWLVSGNVSVAAGTYLIRVTVRDTDDGSGITTQNFTTFTIVVNKEKTATDYIGDFDLMTAGPAVSTATVQLRAKLTEENDGAAGDLTKATATFKIYKFSATSPTYVIPNVPVDALGQATSMFTLPADTYSISVEVDSANGYWTADPINLGLLNITVPSDEQRSTGGGWVPDSTSASGKANLAFSVTASKNGQPKGNVSFSFRGDDGYNYLVKGNSWQGGYLQFSAEPGVTPIVYTLSKIKGNCNVQKIDPSTGVVVASFGNHSFEMFARDGDLLSPRQRDSYSITVRNASGGLFHSVGSQFSLVELGGGNVTNKAR